MGVVHHAAYVVWLEEGRSSWMRKHGSSYAQFEREGLLLQVSEVQLRYRQPARYDRQITVRCWVEELKSRQITFSYEVIDTESGMLCANGYTKHICVNREGQVTTLPERWRRFLGVSPGG